MFWIVLSFGAMDSQDFTCCSQDESAHLSSRTQRYLKRCLRKEQAKIRAECDSLYKEWEMENYRLKRKWEERAARAAAKAARDWDENCATEVVETQLF